MHLTKEKERFWDTQGLHGFTVDNMKGLRLKAWSWLYENCSIRRLLLYNTHRWVSVKGVRAKYLLMYKALQDNKVFPSLIWISVYF